MWEFIYAARAKGKNFNMLPVWKQYHEDRFQKPGLAWTEATITRKPNLESHSLPWKADECYGSNVVHEFFTWTGCCNKTFRDTTLLCWRHRHRPRRLTGVSFTGFPINTAKWEQQSTPCCSRLGSDIHRLRCSSGGAAEACICSFLRSPECSSQ